MKQIEKRIIEYMLTEQSADCLLPSELKVKILSEAGQIWIQPQGFGKKCVSDDEGFPVGIEIWQGKLRLIVFDDINEEDPKIIVLENAKETARLNNESKTAKPNAEHPVRKCTILLEACKHILDCLDVGGEQSRQFADEITYLKNALRKVNHSK
ncbi:MAG: hypothetical protein ABFD79_00410 [Phycisphaerales bacterium]